MPLSRKGRYARVLACLVFAWALAASFFASTPSRAYAEPGDLMRGTVVAPLSLYSSMDATSEPVATLEVGTSFQCVEVAEGWWGASFDGQPLYLCDVSNVGVYTAADSTVLRGAVVGGDLSVLGAPAEGVASAATFASGATIQFCVFNDSYYSARLAD